MAEYSELEILLMCIPLLATIFFWAMMRYHAFQQNLPRTIYYTILMLISAMTYYYLLVRKIIFMPR